MKKFLRLLISWFIRLFWDVEIVGKENLPPEQPMLIVANHSHLLDPFLISTVFPYNATAMAKQEAFKHLVPRTLLRWLDVEPVDREGGDIRAIRKSIEILKDQSFVVFPEGTRNRTGFQLEAKPGAALIAKKANVPIFPITIAGSFRPLSRITVVFHPAVRVEEFGYSRYHSDTYSMICNELMTNIYETLREYLDYAC